MHPQLQLASAKCKTRFYAHLLTFQTSSQLDRLTLSFFPVRQNHTLVQVLFQGDDLLELWLIADGDSNHQYLSIVGGVCSSNGVAYGTLVLIFVFLAYSCPTPTRGIIIYIPTCSDHVCLNKTC